MGVNVTTMTPLFLLLKRLLRFFELRRYYRATVATRFRKDKTPVKLLFLRGADWMA
jgi:hypothetical protein